MNAARDMLRLDVEAVSTISPLGGRPLVLKRLMEGDPPPPPTMHADRYLLAGDVNIQGGSGDAGKSTTLFHIAVCTVLGRPIFGSLAVRRPGPAVLVVPEDGIAIARHHVDALVAGLEITDAERHVLADDLHIVGDDRPFNVLTDTAALAALLVDVRPTLVILDPLSSLLAGADEIDEKVAEAACRALRDDIARPFGAAVVVAAHIRKPSREAGASSTADVNDLKGSAGWANHARMVWMVSKPKGGDTITFRLVKSNRLPTGIEHHVKLTIEANPDNEAHWLSCTLTDANMGASSHALTPGVGRPINDNERRALMAVDDTQEPGKRFSWSAWVAESGVKDDTLKSIKRRLIDADLVAPFDAGPHRNGGKLYAYAITEKGRNALSGGLVNGFKGERVT